MAKYLIFFILFFILYSLFFVAVPVFAEEEKDPCPALVKAGCPTIENKSAFLPDCVYYEGHAGLNVEKCCGCRNINVLVSLLVKAANWALGFAGAAALVAFIYGGFVILTAAGVAEKVKKGKDVLVAAVIGLVIIFSAQVGMRFLVKIILPEAGGTEGAKLETQGLNIQIK